MTSALAGPARTRECTTGITLTPSTTLSWRDVSGHWSHQHDMINKICYFKPWWVIQNMDVTRFISKIWLKSQTHFIQIKHLFRDIKEGRPTKIPKYDYKSNCRVPNSFTTIRPQQVLTTKYLLQLIYLWILVSFLQLTSFQVDVVLFEGILTFYNPEVRN